MPCAYCDADVDGGCTSAAGSSDCLLGQLRQAQSDAQGWRVDYKQARREKNRAAEEARSWRAVAERLETEMQDLLLSCDCEIRDQTNNRESRDKQSAAYAEGALRVAKGIAARIREKSAVR